MIDILPRGQKIVIVKGYQAWDESHCVWEPQVALEAPDTSSGGIDAQAND